MWSKVRRTEGWFYAAAVSLVLGFWLAHVVSLRLLITYDGLGYIDLSDVLGSSRFPADWNVTRTPLFPLSLKIAFLMFGRQALTAILVPALYALGGTLLLGASVKRLAGPLAAAVVILAVSAFPTLVAYEHCVLTETGSLFFISLALYTLLWTPRRLWHRTAALALALAAAYYWRQNILSLAPVIALVHVLTAGNEFQQAPRGAWWNRILSAWPLAANGFVVLFVPLLLTAFWAPYLHSSELRDTTLKQGMLRQALLPPEHPLVGKYRDDYYLAIRASLYHGNFISGMRWNLMSELGDKIWGNSPPKQVPRLFLDLIAQNPGRYINAFDRTMAFYAGMNGVESDNRIYRDTVLSGAFAGAGISSGPEPLRSLIAHDFEQRTTPSLVMRFIRGLIPIYEPLLIFANIVTALGLVFAVAQRDWRLMAFCAIPCVYALGYAVMLVSLDRFVVPVYPLSLANLVLLPIAVHRRWPGQRASGNVRRP